MTARINNAGTAAVDTEYEWQRITDETPRGVKVQLLTRHGVAIYGVLNKTTMDGKNYKAWAPCPRIPDWLRG